MGSGRSKKLSIESLILVIFTPQIEVQESVRKNVTKIINSTKATKDIFEQVLRKELRTKKKNSRSINVASKGILKIIYDINL